MKPLTLAEATRIVREAVRDKSYQEFPLGQEAAARAQVPPCALPTTYAGSRCAVTLVDRDVYEWASKQKWQLQPGGKGGVYVRGTVGGRLTFLHRAILKLPVGSPLRVDHINGLTLDNRRANLRVVTDAQNAQNQGARRKSVSEHRGVGWCNTRRKWIAQATLNGRNHNLGRFDSEEDAARAAADWRAEHMPFSQEAA